MASSKVTSVEVARRAGVSQSAVSRVFTPGASASAKTVEKVRKAAEELGYRPNVLARAMVSGRSRIIGLVVAYLENQFYPVALERLSNTLQARGYHILIFTARNDDEVDSIVEELIAFQVEGIIMASLAISNDLARRCDASNIPLVLFNRGQNDKRYTEVTSDNVAGGRAVAQFLVAGGHRRIAHIAGWSGSSTGRDRAAGFMEGLAEHGLEPVAVEDGMYRQDVASALAHRIFSCGDRPDAVFVGNDHMAFAVMDTLRFGLGLSVPDDVSVFGYDDVPIAAWPAYDLTTIRQPVNQMVDATVEVLFSLIAGRADPQHIRVPGPLKIRGSARKPRGIHP